MSDPIHKLVADLVQAQEDLKRAIDNHRDTHDALCRARSVGLVDIIIILGNGHAFQLRYNKERGYFEAVPAEIVGGDPS